MGQKRRPIPARLPEKLKEIRQRLGLSQEQLVTRFTNVHSLDAGMISRFEQGKREPTLPVLLEYSRLAGVHMELLVDDTLTLPKIK
jgi:transcriptional regulator with XRE-family HTH domain